MIATQVKDPDETLDTGIDWAARLGAGETITASTWTPATGITVDQSSFTDQITSARLSGGTAGTRYAVTNAVTTSLGRVYNETLDIEVRSL